MTAVIRHDALAQLIDSERLQLDSTRAPLMRLTLVRLDDERHHLIYTHHHLSARRLEQLAAVERSAAALRRARSAAADRAFRRLHRLAATAGSPRPTSCSGASNWQPSTTRPCWPRAWPMAPAKPVDGRVCRPSPDLRCRHQQALQRLCPSAESHPQHPGARRPGRCCCNATAASAASRSARRWRGARWTCRGPKASSACSSTPCR